MSKHDQYHESDESHDENTSRPHGGPTSVSTESVQGLTDDDLSVGDVVVVDRSVGSITAKTFATVVAIDERGSRLVGPDYPSPAFGAALDIECVTGYGRLVGRDGDGSYHLLRYDGRGRVVEVVPDPASGPAFEQSVDDDDTLAEWIEHVDAVRSWDSVASEFKALLAGVDRGDGVRTDGGGSGGDIEQRLPIGVTNECDNCGAENSSGQVLCAICGRLVRDV